MPTLLLLAPCEKVVVDQNNACSLIAILEEVKIQVVPGTPVPVGTVIPMQWAVVTLWEQASAYDVGRTFEQRTALVSASGKHLVELVGQFTSIEHKPRVRLINQIVGMPVSEPGSHKIKIWFRELAQEPKEWKEVATYPITIDLTQPPSPDSPN